MATKVPTPGPRTDSSALVSMHLRRGVLDLLSCQERCLLAPARAEVHALRLAARHLQPVLQVLAHLVLEDRAVARATRQVHGVLHHTSAVREVQVYRKAISALPAPAPLRKALEQAALRTETPATERMRKRLRKLHRESVLKLAARTGPYTTPAAGRRALQRAVAQAKERLQRRIARLQADDPAALHKARIALKRYRYLLDAFAPCLPQMHPAHRAALKRYQARLGRWHDAWILAQRLHAAAAALPPRQRHRCLQVASTKASWCAQEQMRVCAVLRRVVRVAK